MSSTVCVSSSDKGNWVGIERDDIVFVVDSRTVTSFSSIVDAGGSFLSAVA